MSRGASQPAEPFKPEPLAEVEKRAVLATLEHFKGNRTKTAAALGIALRTLGLKLRKWREEEAKEADAVGAGRGS